MARLSDEEIAERLEELQGWDRTGDAISKSFDRGDFKGSVAFVNEVLEPAEEMNHHPDLEISWSRVNVSLSTHSEGGVTGSDFELAGKIDSLADQG